MEFDSNINVARSARILIVDDQAINIGAISDILSRAGYAIVISITDASEALAKFKELQPDLLLLDWHMGPVSGLDFIQEIKAAVPQEAIPPILVLTADNTPETRREALAVGATDFLSKPLNLSETLLRIRNLLSMRFLQRQLDAERQEVENRARDVAEQLAAAQAELTSLRERVAGDPLAQPAA